MGVLTGEQDGPPSSRQWRVIQTLAVRMGADTKHNCKKCKGKYITSIQIQSGTMDPMFLNSL